MPDVCMQVYTYVYKPVYNVASMQVCTFASVHVSMSANNMYARLQVCIYARMQIWMYACMHIVNMQIFKYSYMYTCIYAYMQVWKHTSIKFCKFASMQVVNIESM